MVQRMSVNTECRFIRVVIGVGVVRVVRVVVKVVRVVRVGKSQML
jgi:hypothetical protein